MPVHDWSKVDDGVFHDFHVGWIPEIRKALNGGLLPAGYYAMAEQHAGRAIADVLTLHESAPPAEPFAPPPDTGGTAVAESPPRVRRKQVIDPTAINLRRTLAIRHVSGHRLIALIEIVSPANKDRRQHIDDFVWKVLSALDRGIHVLIVDLVAPGPSDPHGLHELLLQNLEGPESRYDLPVDEPLTLASYVAGPRIESYLEHVAVGAALPAMPLFLRTDRYVNVPFESTYASAYVGMPAFWRGVLEENGG